MRKERVKKWDVRSFERNADAAFWLNELQRVEAGLTVESASVDGEEITLVVSYVTDEE